MHRGLTGTWKRSWPADLSAPLAWLCGGMAQALGGCGPDLGAPVPSEPGGAAVRLEPAAPFEEVPRVVRVHVQPGLVGPEGLLVFQGPLSPYHEGRVRRGDLPRTLEERRIPLRSWATAEGVVAAPLRELTPGERYAVAALGVGSLVTLRVQERGAEPWRIVWPPAGLGPAHAAAVCGPGPAPEGQILLDPAGWRAALRPLACCSEGCRVVDPDAPAEEGDRVLLPPQVGEVPLEPREIWLARRSPVAPRADCPRGEEALGPACVLPRQDHVVVASLVPAAWWVSTGASDVSRVVAAGERFAVPAPEPGGVALVRAAALGLGGLSFHGEARVQLAEAAPEPRISEVLANPFGPEPAQEWVELENRGRLAWRTAGFTLGDAGGSAALPTCEVPPGGRVVVVSEGFSGRADGPDVPPVAGAVVLRVAQLGKSGLSNTGEALVLSGPRGEAWDRFPALPHAAAGVSLARCGDDDAPRRHAAPGASPGGENRCE